MFEQLLAELSRLRDGINGLLMERTTLVERYRALEAESLRLAEGAKTLMEQCRQLNAICLAQKETIEALTRKVEDMRRGKEEN